jgi:hypothetical protein
MLRDDVAMDPLSHLLITRALFRQSRSALLACLAPDVPFYATYPAWLIRHGYLAGALQTNDWPVAPPWMYRLHHAFHSLPVIGAVMITVRLARGVWPPWGLAWVLHILVDIPTHSRRNWAPQFLWPFSTVTVDGISWPELLVSAVHRLRR